MSDDKSVRNPLDSSMGRFKIIISPASNGAMVTVDLGEEDMVPQNTVYLFETDFPAKLEGLVSMLYAIAEDLGACGSKHDQQRLCIDIVHGDNYDCVEAGCPICARLAEQY